MTTTTTDANEKVFSHVQLLTIYGILGDFRNMPSILAGKHEESIRLLCYWDYFHNLPRFANELNLPEIEERFLFFMENLRFTAKTAINNIAQFEAQQLEYAKRREEEIKRSEFLKQNRVHEQGTVKEIAERLGLSISEVRRRKRDGEL